MTTLLEYNRQLAALLKAAANEGHPINTDGDEGCSPCNTLDEESSCVGCPYRMRDMGADYKEIH